MKKILLTSFCAVALSSTASAFVVDLSSLIGTTFGTTSVTQGAYTIDFTANPGAASVNSLGEIRIVAGEVLTVVFSGDSRHTSSNIDGLAGLSQNAAANEVTYTAGTGGGTIRAISAVPEPSSTALLGLGGLALILRRRK